MDQLRQAEAEHEGADTAGAAKRIRAKSPFVDLMFPAAKRQRVPCNRCGEEVDNASCQPDSTKEDSDFWKCRACNSNLVRLWKEHGKNGRQMTSKSSMMMKNGIFIRM